MSRYSTRQRKLLLDYLSAHPHQLLSAGEIARDLREREVSLSAVYRNLAQLEAEGKIFVIRPEFPVLVSRVEQSGKPVSICRAICPLIGNGGVGLKNYHSNELVRVLAECSGAQPEFIYSPACVLSEQELRLTKELENYRAVREAWERLDAALVNIGNFPSVPDFASEARYGDLLVKQKAVGRILNYFVDGNGHVIHSDTDYAIQIPLELLGRVRHVVGICSANTKPKALSGVLRSGYVNHIIAPEHVVKAVLEE